MLEISKTLIKLLSEQKESFEIIENANYSVYEICWRVHKQSILHNFDGFLRARRLEEENPFLISDIFNCNFIGIESHSEFGVHEG